MKIADEQITDVHCQLIKPFHLSFGVSFVKIRRYKTRV